MTGSAGRKAQEITPTEGHTRVGLDSACPLCGEREMQIRYQGIQDRLGHVAGTFNFHRCQRCQSASLVPFPKDDDAAAFYPPSYMVTAPTSIQGVGGLLRRVEWRLLFLSVYGSGAETVLGMTGMSSGRLLEIGCSSGYQLREFSRRAEFETLGVDIDGAAVDHATAELRLNVVHRSFLEAGLPGSYFDVVILFNVLEHLTNPFAALEEIRRILKPGGYLAIKTQFIDSLQARLFGSRWMVLGEAPRHVLVASRKGISHLIKRAGMQVVGIKSGPVLENSTSIALSIFPCATSLVAFKGKRLVLGWLRRLVGILVGFAAIPFAALEQPLARSGTSICVAQKVE